MTTTTTMSETALSELAKAAADTAMRAAVEYLRRHNLTVDAGVLCECLRSNLRIRLSEALADARAAIDCNMNQVAAATFTATMMQAGIDAAKECGTPK